MPLAARTGARKASTTTSPALGPAMVATRTPNASSHWEGGGATASEWSEKLVPSPKANSGAAPEW